MSWADKLRHAMGTGHVVSFRNTWGAEWKDVVNETTVGSPVTNESELRALIRDAMSRSRFNHAKPCFWTAAFQEAVKARYDLSDYPSPEWVASVLEGVAVVRRSGRFNQWRVIA